MRAILFVLAVVVSIATAHAAGLEGHWSGTWTKAGDALNVTVEFSKTPTGYAGAFASDALEVAGIPLTEITPVRDSFRFELRGDATTIMFFGKVVNDAFTGTLEEGPIRGTFHLKRTVPPARKVREITFANRDVTLAGELVLPTSAGRHPAVLFLHGSGPEGRWASRYLARKFAARGVAALIYDKRGVGASKGDWQAAGFEVLADDAAAGIRLLAAQPEVDPARIGIYGHSQGGTISPLVAVRAVGIAFVIASAASGLDPAETEIYSVENAIGLARLPASEQADARLFVRTIVDVAYRGAQRATLYELVSRFKNRPWFFEPPPPDHSYWTLSRRIAAYRALEFWQRVKAPVLLLYGERDERVPPRPSADAILAALKAGSNPPATLKIYPNADHTLRLIRGEGQDYDWPRRVPGYADTLIDWVLSKN
jgi:alpha-beta hydrolase superfamily lysophospholipase